MTHNPDKTRELLLRAVREVQRLRDEVESLERAGHEPLAIVGLGLRTPGGVVDLASLWQLLESERDPVTPVPGARWDAERDYDPDPEAQGYYEVKTWWRSLEDFVAWTKSESFAEAHRNRPPKEMFAGPNVLEIHEVMTSTDLELDASS